jgi:hypothetical protein
MQKPEFANGKRCAAWRLWSARKLRIFLVAGVLVFVGLFQLIYVTWLYPVFGYYGFDNSDPSWMSLAIAWLLSALPSLWMPIRLTRPSQLIYWVLYLVVYVPSMFVPLYAGLESTSDVLRVMFALFIGLAILGSSYLCPLVPIRYPGLPRPIFKAAFASFAVALVAWMVVVFRGHLQFVSFWDVYDLRFAANDVMEGSLVNYAVMWLTAVVAPVCMALGLYSRRPIVLLTGVFTEVLVYSATAAKAALFAICVVLIFYVLLRSKEHLFGVKFTWCCALLLFALFLARSLDNAPVTWALSIVLMRTFGNSGLMTTWYSDFFERNPITHYSHVTGVNWVIPYPYKNPLGIEVGSFYSGDPTLDANAHFWATDGLAAWGFSGIALVSVLCALLFLVVDSAARRHDVRLAALLVSFAAVNLSNVSLFTSFLSGGLGLLIVAMVMMPTFITN